MLPQQLQNLQVSHSSMSIFGVSPLISVPLAAILVWVLVVRGSYRYVERILLGLCLIYFSYVFSAIVIHPNWGQVLHEYVDTTNPI